jgi:hypothetical protein
MRDNPVEMMNKEGISELHERLKNIRESATTFFNDCRTLQEKDGGEYADTWDDLLTEELRTSGLALRADVKRLSVDIAGAARGSPLIAEADLQDLRHNTRHMVASLGFHRYSYRGVYVHHDEDIVLGVDPPRQGEEPVGDVAKAIRWFDVAATKVTDLVDLLLPSDALAVGPAGSASYRPNTAFIMMAIDKAEGAA